MKLTEASIFYSLQKNKALIDAVLCSISLLLFAFLIIYPYPLKATAFIPLVFAAFIISRNLKPPIISQKVSIKNVFSFRIAGYLLIGLLMGTAGAMYYRGSFGMSVFPALIRNFAFIAVCIGIMEELVFRGYIQGQLNQFHPSFAIFFAAFAHASYKAFLFLSPAAQHHPSIVLFYTWSFAAFMLIGLLRYYSKSILPAIVVHAVFDLFVYAENTTAPWWVW